MYIYIYTPLYICILTKISRMSCDGFIVYIGSIMRPYRQVEQAPPPAVQGEMKLEREVQRSSTNKGV